MDAQVDLSHVIHDLLETRTFLQNTLKEINQSRKSISKSSIASGEAGKDAKRSEKEQSSIEGQVEKVKSTLDKVKLQRKFVNNEFVEADNQFINVEEWQERVTEMKKTLAVLTSVKHLLKGKMKSTKRIQESIIKENKDLQEEVFILRKEKSEEQQKRMEMQTWLRINTKDSLETSKCLYEERKRNLSMKGVIKMLQENLLKEKNENVTLKNHILTLCRKMDFQDVEGKIDVQEKKPSVSDSDSSNICLTLADNSRDAETRSDNAANVIPHTTKIYE